MKIGIFDSGLGGLFTMKGIAKAMPAYDYVYLGDTKRLPYGNRSADTIFEFLKDGVDFLFSKECLLVIVACNTASAEALRRVQREYLPKKYPGKRVLGMIVPTVEECAGMDRVGIIATTGTINSKAYEKEFKKRSPKTKVISYSAPLLVPLIENGGKKWIEPVLAEYLKNFKNKKIEALILGCTHYPLVERAIKKIMGKDVAIISQNKIIPPKIKDYLKRHGEIDRKLSKKSSRQFFVTDITLHFQKLAKEWFGKDIKLKKVEIGKKQKNK